MLEGHPTDGLNVEANAILSRIYSPPSSHFGLHFRLACADVVFRRCRTCRIRPISKRELRSFFERNECFCFGLVEYVDDWGMVGNVHGLVGITYGLVLPSHGH